LKAIATTMAVTIETPRSACVETTSDSAATMPAYAAITTAMTRPYSKVRDTTS
jgi:hypothetical protein